MLPFPSPRQEFLSLETSQQSRQLLHSPIIYLAFPEQKSPKKAQHEAIPPQSPPDNPTTAQLGSGSPQQQGWSCNSSVKSMNQMSSCHVCRVLPGHVSPQEEPSQGAQSWLGPCHALHLQLRKCSCSSSQSVSSSTQCLEAAPGPFQSSPVSLQLLEP